MKLMTSYKLLILSIFFILPFQFSIASGETDKEKKDPVEWLFVISSKEGEIKKSAEGQYELILKHAHIERVLAFTDRPNRMVKFISPQAFKKLWGEGKNSFEKDPPNAIAVFGQEKIAIKLISTTLDNEKTSFIVTSDDDRLQEVKMGDVSVFIDSKGICPPRNPRRQCPTQFSSGGHQVDWK